MLIASQTDREPQDNSVDIPDSETCMAIIKIS